jgi:hypothetical protein
LIVVMMLVAAARPRDVAVGKTSRCKLESLLLDEIGTMEDRFR